MKRIVVVVASVALNPGGLRGDATPAWSREYVIKTAFTH